MRLIGVELRRAFARRLTKLLIVVSIAGIVAAGIAVYFHSNRRPCRPSGAHSARARVGTSSTSSSSTRPLTNGST